MNVATLPGNDSNGGERETQPDVPQFFSDPGKGLTRSCECRRITTTTLISKTVGCDAVVVVDVGVVVDATITKKLVYADSFSPWCEVFYA